MADKAWVVTATRRRPVLEEIDLGPLGGEDVEVASEHRGLCHSDLSILDDDWGISRYPAVLGHEAVGRVMAVGPSAKGLVVGQVVGVGWYNARRVHCRQCLSGDQDPRATASATIVGGKGGLATGLRRSARDRPAAGAQADEPDRRGVRPARGGPGPASDRPRRGCLNEANPAHEAGRFDGRTCGMLAWTRRGPNRVGPSGRPFVGPRIRSGRGLARPFGASRPGSDPRRPMTSEGARGRRGPAKAFDVAEALDAAMLVFWKKGFEGASLTDLTEAMGINRPSLYATFGDKQELYRRAVGRFGEIGRPVFEASAAEPTARRFAERLLRGQAELYSTPELAPGCFLIQSAISTSAQSRAARDEAAARRRSNESAARQHLEDPARRAGLPPGVSPAELASYLASVGHGIAVRAADGATREELNRVVDLALAFWPDPVEGRHPGGEAGKG